MALLKHRKVTLTEYRDFDYYDMNTEYTITEGRIAEPRVIGRAIGNRIISGGEFIVENDGVSNIIVKIGHLKGKVLIVIEKHTMESKSMVDSIVIDIDLLKASNFIQLKGIGMENEPYDYLPISATEKIITLKTTELSEMHPQEHRKIKLYFI